ncbi:MAG: hypothetical protein AB7O98_13990 [Hyphomonadaceae bacterium]
MQAPQSLDEAKAMVRTQRLKIASSVSLIAGSRWLLAILATFVIAFATHLAYAPERLPTVGGLSVAQAGLPPIDFGLAGEQAQTVRERAKDEDVRGRAVGWVDANRDKLWIVNSVGLAVALILLAINVTIMTRRRRYTEG